MWTTQDGFTTVGEEFELLHDFNKNYMRIILLTVLHLFVYTQVIAQDIFSGGISSALAMDCYQQPNPIPDPFTNVFNGGIASGYSSVCVGSIEPIPLPIEVIDFTALLKNWRVELEWRTMSEMETDFFRIEKSLDGTNWVQLAEINASGSTGQENQYQLDDLNLVLGLQYYRLSQHNYSGQREYFGPRAIYYEGEMSDFMLFPNPCMNSMTLVFPMDLKGPFRMEISDEAGRICTSMVIDKNPHTFTYDVSHLAPGIYHISMSNPRKKAHLKMIKVESTNQK